MPGIPDSSMQECLFPNGPTHTFGKTGLRTRMVLRIAHKTRIVTNLGVGGCYVCIQGGELNEQNIKR
jgi:hypothetical protein